MRFLTLFVLFLIGIIFTACPYESDIAITTSKSALKIEPSFKGEWVAYHEDGAKEELQIIKVDKTTYGVLHKHFAPKNKLKANYKYTVHFTSINQTKILNIKNKAGKFLFSKYNWEGKNIFTLESINADFMNTNFKADTVSTVSLRNFLSENISNEKLYDEGLEFYRKYSPEYEKVRMYLNRSGF